METRIAILEEIAAATRQAVAGLREEWHETNRRVDALGDALECDFQLLFGAIIAVAIGLTPLMGSGFHWF